MLVGGDCYSEATEWVRGSFQGSYDTGNVGGKVIESHLSSAGARAREVDSLGCGGPTVIDVQGLQSRQWSLDAALDRLRPQLDTSVSHHVEYDGRAGGDGAIGAF